MMSDKLKPKQNSNRTQEKIGRDACRAMGLKYPTNISARTWKRIEQADLHQALAETCPCGV